MSRRFCRDAPRLIALLEEQLTPEEEQRVYTHLDECSDCQLRLTAFNQVAREELAQWFGAIKDNVSQDWPGKPLPLVS